MKHIATYQGTETNYLEMDDKDFFELKKFLELIGVRIRMTTDDARTGICMVQGENCYETQANLYRDQTGETIIRLSESMMKRYY